MTSLILTVRESIRYRGRSGQYSWLAHRISGLAILFFLVIHVWDTANALFWPQASPKAARPLPGASPRTHAPPSPLVCEQ